MGRRPRGLIGASALLRAAAARYPDDVVYINNIPYDVTLDREKQPPNLRRHIVMDGSAARVRYDGRWKCFPDVRYH